MIFRTWTVKKLADRLNHNYYLPILVTLSSPLLWVNSLSAIALSPVEVQRIANKTTIRIKGCDQGSGVIIQKSGNTYTVLTVAHAAHASGCQIVTADDREYPVTQVIAPNNNVDLAVIKFQSNQTYQVAKLIDNSDRVEGGENIYVSGFPVTNTISEPIFTFVQGRVIGNGNKLQPKGYSMVYDNATLPGHSGGPVWNDQGQIVAIHGRGDLDTRLEKTDNPNIRIKTGFNLGITTNTFAKMAGELGVNQFAPPKPTVAKNPPPKPVDDLIASAVVKESKGDYAGILDDMNRAIAIAPQKDRLYYIRGNARAQLGDLPGAISDYSRDIAMNPRRSTSYYNRGNVYYRSGKLPQALADYNTTIEIEPQQFAAFYNRGNVRSKLKDYRGSIDDYSTAIAINPRLVAAYSSRGWVKYQSGDDSGSIADYDLSITMNHPQMGKIYSQKALAQYELGNISAAIDSWRKALNLQRLKTDTQMGLAIALYRQGKQEEALQLAITAISSDKSLKDMAYLRDTKNWRTSILKDAIPLLQHPRLR